MTDNTVCGGQTPAPPRPNPLIFGTVLPRFEPVPVKEQGYVPLTNDDVWRFSIGRSEKEAIRLAHQAGAEGRSAP